MNISTQTVESLKSEGHYFAAGALSRALGHGRAYGCHYGMRSELKFARVQFNAGYDASTVTPRIDREA